MFGFGFPDPDPREKNGKNGAAMPTDLNSPTNYVWTNGRLTIFEYGGTAGKVMKGSLDLTPFTELESVLFNNNELTAINVTGLTELLHVGADDGVSLIGWEKQTVE